MKSIKFLKYVLVTGAVVFFATGISFAQSASPSTPEEKKAADEVKSDAAKKNGGTESAELELTEPVIVTSGEAEKPAEAAEETKGATDAAVEASQDTDKIAEPASAVENKAPETKKAPVGAVEKK